MQPTGNMDHGDKHPPAFLARRLHPAAAPALQPPPGSPTCTQTRRWDCACTGSRAGRGLAPARSSPRPPSPRSSAAAAAAAAGAAGAAAQAAAARRGVPTPCCRRRAAAGACVDVAAAAAAGAAGTAGEAAAQAAGVPPLPAGRPMPFAVPAWVRCCYHAPLASIRCVANQSRASILHQQQQQHRIVACAALGAAAQAAGWPVPSLAEAHHLASLSHVGWVTRASTPVSQQCKPVSPPTSSAPPAAFSWAQWYNRRVRECVVISLRSLRGSRSP